MPDCKGCGNWFGSATDSDLCPICERVLERLNGYAAPVVHGHWIKNDNNFECSKCGETISMRRYMEDRMCFCNYCGAKMDEVSE